jgi:hypothetical protein
MRSDASSLGFYPKPIVEAASVLTNLVHMLGYIGNPTMLLEDPTEPGFCHYDSFINGYVYQVPEPTEDIGLGIQHYVVHELAAGDVLDIRAEPSFSALPEIAEDGGPEGGSGERLEVPMPSGLSDLGSSLISSIQTPGSWDRLS